MSVNKEMGSEEGEEKWVKHYSSNHQILLVGDGDFSFSLSLALSFGSASNIVASSLDSYDEVITKYTNAKSNLQKLEKLGASHLHGVDATKMKLHSDLKMRKFDRIIFSFPHAGSGRKETDLRLIIMHRKLVSSFFANARWMLRPYGEIHVNHKTTPPFCCWNLEELASKNSLALVERVEFKKQDYPGYTNKRGDGPRCNKPFPLGKSSTFIFIRFYPSTDKYLVTPHICQLQKAPSRLQSLIVYVDLDATMRNGSPREPDKTEPSRTGEKRSRTRSTWSNLVKPDQSLSVTSFARNISTSDWSRRLQSKTSRYSLRSLRELGKTESSRTTGEIRSKTRSYSVKSGQSLPSSVTSCARNISALDWSRRLRFDHLTCPIRDDRRPNLRSSDERSHVRNCSKTPRYSPSSSRELNKTELPRTISENQSRIRSIWSNSIKSDQSRPSSISSFARNIPGSEWSQRLQFNDSVRD